MVVTQFLGVGDIALPFPSADQFSQRDTQVARWLQLVSRWETRVAPSLTKRLTPRRAILGPSLRRKLYIFIY